MKSIGLMLSVAVAFTALAAIYAPIAYAAEKAVSPEAAGTQVGDGGNAADKDKLAEAQRLYFSGMNMINHGDYKSAVKDLEKALKLNPNHYSTCLMLGKVYTRVGKPGDSINTFHKAMKLEPSNPEAYDNLMHLYVFMNQYDKSLEVAEKAISAGARKSALTLLGWTYYQVGKLDEAEERFNDELKSYGEFYGAYRNLGLVSFSRGDYEKAAEYLEKAEKIEPENKSLPYILALTYEKLGRVADVWREVKLFKARNKRHLTTIDEYNERYFPHTDPGSVKDYIFFLKPGAPGSNKPAESDE